MVFNDGYFRWSYFEEACEINQTPLVSSTNLSEGINSAINKGIRYCANVNEQVAHIRNYQIKQIDKYYELKHTNYWHPTKRSKTSERHQKLTEILNNFKNQGIVNQVDIVLETALEIGQLMMQTKRRL